MGMAIGMVNEYDGQIIVSSAPQMAGAWAELARQDPKVAKAMMKLIQASGWGLVIAAHLPVAVGILANHGKTPAALFQRPQAA
jgi:ABC-type phosphate/phosphonate transport system permease subunit